jgi:hypothetical protein
MPDIRFEGGSMTRGHDKNPPSVVTFTPSGGGPVEVYQPAGADPDGTLIYRQK